MSADLLDRPPSPAAADLARGLAALPPLPATVHGLMAMMQNETTSMEAITRELGQDPPATLRVLRLANSPFFGMPGRIGGLRDAVSLLGLRSVGAMLVMQATQQAWSAWPLPASEIARHGRHALEVALTARKLAAEGDADVETTFLAGLLHDVGRLAMRVLQPEQPGVDLRRARDDGLSLRDAEWRHWGTTHDTLGAELLALWKLPTRVVQAVAAHHLLPAPEDGVARAVHLADALCHHADDPAQAGLYPVVDCCRPDFERALEGWPEWRASIATVPSEE